MSFILLFLCYLVWAIIRIWRDFFFPFSRLLLAWVSQLSNTTSLKWKGLGLAYRADHTACHSVSSLALSTPVQIRLSQASVWLSPLFSQFHNFMTLLVAVISLKKQLSSVSEPAVKCGCLVSTGSYQERNVFYGILKARKVGEGFSLFELFQPC